MKMVMSYKVRQLVSSVGRQVGSQQVGSEQLIADAVASDPEFEVDNNVDEAMAIVDAAMAAVTLPNAHLFSLLKTLQFGLLTSDVPPMYLGQCSLPRRTLGWVLMTLSALDEGSHFSRFLLPQYLIIRPQKTFEPSISGSCQNENTLQYLQLTYVIKNWERQKCGRVEEWKSGRVSDVRKTCPNWQDALGTTCMSVEAEGRAKPLLRQR